MASVRSSSDREAIAEAWRRSGETQKAFASKRGIPLTRLQSWIYRRRRPRPSSARLVEVRVSTPPQDFGPLEIVLPSGITVRVSVGTEPAWTSALVKSLLG